MLSRCCRVFTIVTLSSGNSTSTVSSPSDRLAQSLARTTTFRQKSGNTTRLRLHQDTGSTQLLSFMEGEMIMLYLPRASKGSQKREKTFRPREGKG